MPPSPFFEEPVLLDGVEGVVGLWNSPDILKTLLLQLRREIDHLVSSESLSRAKALEKIRESYEKKNGFKRALDLESEEVRGFFKDADPVLTTDQWHQLLRWGHPYYDSLVSHLPMSDNPLSVGSYGEQVHRNQWLLVMMALNSQPELFGKFAGHKAVLLYKELGAEQVSTWNIEMPGFGWNAHRKQASVWFFLFDRVDGRDVMENGARINRPYANFSNPIYFVEVFRLGLRLSPRD